MQLTTEFVNTFIRKEQTMIIKKKVSITLMSTLSVSTKDDISFRPILFYRINNRDCYSIEWVKEKDEHYAKDLQRGFPNCRELLFFFIIIQISPTLRYIRIKRHSKIA